LVFPDEAASIKTQSSLVEGWNTQNSKTKTVLPAAAMIFDPVS
jgi:hypothetical protein